MSSRKSLVARSRLSQGSSPAQRRRGEETETPQAAPLPPYEPPSFPLTANQKRALDNLRVNYDGAAYKKHLEVSKKNITNAIGEANDRLTAHKMKVQRAEEKARQHERDKTEAEAEEERYTQTMNKKVTDSTAKGEKAMRDLIDYTDELVMRDSIMTEVNENIAAAPAPVPRIRRQRLAAAEDEEEDEENMAEEAPAEDATILSPVELLQKAKEDYKASYISKSMADRYVNNDYKSFKRTVHDAMHPGENAPPVPHASTWFSETQTGGAQNKRARTSTDNANEESEEEDDVIIAGATKDLKCPLTLQMFVEPYSNNVCPHAFEKSAITAYLDENGVAFAPPNQRRGQRTPQGPKQVKCPTVGCEAMLELNDFYDDQLLLRQVKRAQRRDQMDDDDDADDSQRQGGPEEIFDDSSILPEERRRSLKVKSERLSQLRDESLVQKEEEGEDDTMNSQASDA